MLQAVPVKKDPIEVLQKQDFDDQASTLVKAKQKKEVTSFEQVRTTSPEVEKSGTLTDNNAIQPATNLSRSFFEMRPSKRLSCASNASSLDSSHSSTASDESQQHQQQQQQQLPHKPSPAVKGAIEILSSDDEEDNEEKDVSDSDLSMPQFEGMLPASHERELKTLQFTLKNQEVHTFLFYFVKLHR